MLNQIDILGFVDWVEIGSSSSDYVLEMGSIWTHFGQFTIEPSLYLK